MHEGNKLKIEYEYDLKRKLKQQQAEEERREREKEKEEEAAQVARNKRNNTSNASTPVNASSSTTGANSSATSSKPPSTPPPPRFPDCSIIADLFQGTLESRVTCKSCGAVSLTKDPFYDLSLEIPKESQLKKISAERGEEALTPQASRGFFGSISNYLGLTSPTLSLETCLHSFCTSDSLLQKDQYKCDKCKEKVDAVKILSLGSAESLPEVLTLHIKRFAHNTYFGSKIGRHVTFPLYNLDVAPYLTPANATEETVGNKKGKHSNHQNNIKPKKFDSQSSSSSSSSSSSPALYNLFALVRHMGSVNGGHYIAYCRSHVTGKWFEFDDKTVTEVSEERVSKVEAYLLFYRRTHPVGPYQQLVKHLDAVTIRDLPPTPSQHPPPVRYVSKYWLKKMEVFGRPEPIDNRDLCCSHGLPKPLPYVSRREKIGDELLSLFVWAWVLNFSFCCIGGCLQSTLGWWRSCDCCDSFRLGSSLQSLWRRSDRRFSSRFGV